MKKLSNVQRGYIRLSAVMLVFFTVAVVGWEFVEAHNAKLAAIPPAIQSGTAVIYPGGDTFGFTYVHLDFPALPILVVSLQTQVPVNYVTGVAFSGDIGSITVELQEPADYPVYVNWVATMPTEAAKEGTE